MPPCPSKCFFTDSIIEFFSKECLSKNEIVYSYSE